MHVEWYFGKMMTATATTVTISNSNSGNNETATSTKQNLPVNLISVHFICEWCVRECMCVCVLTSQQPTAAMRMREEKECNTKKRIKTLSILIVLNAFACTSQVQPHSTQVCARFVLFYGLSKRRDCTEWPIKVGINRSNSYSMEPTTQSMVLFLKSANLGISHFTFQLKRFADGS